MAVGPDYSPGISSLEHGGKPSIGIRHISKDESHSEEELHPGENT